MGGGNHKAKTISGIVGGMKLISLNVEGLTHTGTVFPFLTHEDADIICLQEATEEHVTFLEAAGYQVVFEPRCLKEYNGIEFIDGLLLASKVAGDVTRYCYYKPGVPIEREIFDIETERNPTPRHILVGNFEYESREYTVATTHFTWTKNGFVTEAQRSDFIEFKKQTTGLPPHLMCGDFNIPRHFNPLYEALQELYVDEIPETYPSSIDMQFHRKRDDPVESKKLRQYMVDYIFQTGGYHVKNVRLQFGVSDHAAIVAEITKK